jgi:hypothetical protein
MPRTRVFFEARKKTIPRHELVFASCTIGGIAIDRRTCDALRRTDEQIIQTDRTTETLFSLLLGIDNIVLSKKKKRQHLLHMKNSELSQHQSRKKPPTVVVSEFHNLYMRTYLFREFDIAISAEKINLNIYILQQRHTSFIRGSYS